MEKKIIKILLGLLLVSMMVSVFVLQGQDIREKEDIDWSFKTALVQASGGFANNEKNTQTKQWDTYYYNQAMANLLTAANLLQFTTFQTKSNDYLDVVLSNLYTIMAQDKYQDSVMGQSEALHKDLLDLSQNPENKKAGDDIAALVDTIWHIK